jgi:hypothetical protein
MVRGRYDSGKDEEHTTQSGMEDKDRRREAERQPQPPAHAGAALKHEGRHSRGPPAAVDGSAKIPL